MNLPNLLTLSRFFLSALFMVFLYRPGPYYKCLALGAFLAGVITDYADGWLARKRGEVTALGQLLDPIADKVLVFSAFLSFVEMKILPAWMVILMLTREVLVTGFRLLGATRGVTLAASRGGKNKAALQAASVTMILVFLAAAETPFWNPDWTLSALAWIRCAMLIVVFATLASGISYTAKNWKKLNGSLD